MLFAEAAWTEMGKKTLFVDAEVECFIEMNSFSVNLSEITPFSNAFSVSFKSSSRFKTSLIRFYPEGADRVYNQGPLFRRMNIPLPLAEGPHDNTGIDTYIGVRVLRAFCPDPPSLQLAYVASRTIGGPSNGDGIDGKTPRGSSVEIVETLRFVVSLLALIQAVPECLVQGPPRGNEIDGRFGQGFRVGLPERFRRLGGTHASPEAHIRSFHFRALRDERYKRNPDGSVRIVPVRMTLVGKDKIDPYHVEIPEEA